MNIYTVDPHCAELYDQVESCRDDADLLLGLIGEQERLSILEPFCGTGRILAPLAEAGHILTGVDQARGFLDRCRDKLAMLGISAVLIEEDALVDDWPGGFDVVVLGANCLYELACEAVQQRIIRFAAAALIPGGHLFLDTNHMEGGLAAAWLEKKEKPCFPSGVCADGVCLQSTIRTEAYDLQTRVVHFKRRTRITFPSGESVEYIYEQQKHPVASGEVRRWVEDCGLEIEREYGSRKGQPYTDNSPRLILWARKPAL